MLRRSLSPSRPVLALVLALAAGACDDAATLPGAPGAHLSAEGAARFQKPVVIPNQTRYRWTGDRPATGRSGSAGLTVQALIGRDGVTEVEVMSVYGEFTGWPQGTLERVQSRAFDPQGRPMFTANHNTLSGGSTAALQYRGLSRGAVLQVQANVRGVDPHRTGVVTVTDTVVMRPNLAVLEVQAPARVRPGRTANVSATIRETNGDTGAWATCGLYVGGELVDWARGIWVDAGDAVTCAFSHQFSGEGAQQVEVRLSDVTPRDDDAGDDAASATVEVFVGTELSYFLNAHQIRSRTYRMWHERWGGSTYESEWRSENTEDALDQAVYIGANVPRALTTQAPRVEVTETSGGVVTASVAYDLTPDWSWGERDFCSYRQDQETGAYLTFCTYTDGGGFTGVQYERHAGSVTYHSSYYSRSWDGLSGEEYVYSENASGQYGSGRFVPFGADIALRVRIHDGETVYAADPAVPFTYREERLDNPLWCSGYEVPEWDYFSETCSEYDQERDVWAVTAYN